MRVVVYFQDTNRRSKIIADAVVRGVIKSGDQAYTKSMNHYEGVEADIAVFYGTLLRPMQDYLAARCHYVYVDLGYWGRLSGGKFEGYHKVSVDARHPTHYFQKVAHDDKRSRVFNKLKIRPWNKEGKYILIAGMSAKGAIAAGFKPEQWEKDIVSLIRRASDRPILYRPKPNWSDYTVIEGCKLDRNADLYKVLEDCYAVVAHHSNVAVDAIIQGVPAFCHEGVARVQSLQDISMIDKPLMRDDREQWVRDIAYTQWSVSEIASGLPWMHLKSEGLVKGG